MSYREWGIVLILLAGSMASGQVTTGPASLPVTQPAPRPLLDQMYRHELGNLYKPADADKLYRAHVLIEHYFAVPEDRRNTIEAIEALGLDPNIVGRLTRLRMNWPALQPGVYYINERVGANDVHYFLGIPKGYDRANPWPLSIMLPTADAFVTDPRPDPAQAADIYAGWMVDELSKHPDAVLIMPLLNLDVLWGPSYVGMDSVIQPMLHVTSRVNIDPARVYLIGHAMSAHAVWNLGLHYPTYFAALDAMAGGASDDWQRLRVMNLRNTLPVVWHDADDQSISPELSRKLVAALRTQKIDVDYVETKGVGHVPSEAIVEERRAKAFARVRETYPAHVSIQSNRPDTMFNRNDWVQIYQPLSPGKEQRLLFTRGGGFMNINSSSSSIDATISKNKIDVTSHNVESMRFYVNDQMIDFSRAVSVVINRIPRFEKILKPGIEQMLKDQLFLGRGWRYYTAVIDIDFGDANRANTPRPTTRP